MEGGFALAGAARHEIQSFDCSIFDVRESANGLLLSRIIVESATGEVLLLKSLLFSNERASTLTSGNCLQAITREFWYI